MRRRGGFHGIDIIRRVVTEQFGDAVELRFGFVVLLFVAIQICQFKTPVLVFSVLENGLIHLNQPILRARFQHFLRIGFQAVGHYDGRVYVVRMAFCHVLEFFVDERLLCVSLRFIRHFGRIPAHNVFHTGLRCRFQFGKVVVRLFVQIVEGDFSGLGERFHQLCQLLACFLFAKRGNSFFGVEIFGCFYLALDQSGEAVGFLRAA